MTKILNQKEISFGLWYDFRNPPSSQRDNSEIYRKTLQHVSYAEELGFDNIWTSEHHFIDDGYSPSLLPICAAIAAITKKVRIGTNVLLLPLHDPLRIAEDAATVDIISDGRFDLGVAAGYKLEEFTGFGVSRNSRAQRMEEAIQVIRKSWSKETFTFEGNFYQYKDVNVTPKPVQDPMPLWIGGFVEPAVRRAARLGDGLLAAANVIPTFSDEWGKQNKGPLPKRIAITTPWALIANEPDIVWETIKDSIFYQRNHYAEWFAAAGQPRHPKFENPEEIRSLFPDIIVTPERAQIIIESLSSELDASHFYWWAIPPGVEPNLTYESMELFANQVFEKNSDD